MTAKTFGRWILTSDGLEKGFLRIEGESLVEVCWGDVPGNSVKALVLPAFVNAHTHIGDSVAFPAPKGSVKEIVGPPDGYKHRILRSKSVDEKVDAMKSAISLMRASGTACFADFREEGIEGLKSLRKANEDLWPRSIVFGRPMGTEPSKGEIDDLLRLCDGIGLSAISDWPLEMLKIVSQQARTAGKMFAIHASEASREDIDLILSLRPDFLVHMCSATWEDLLLCAEAELPVVVCPSSNQFFGLDPGISRLLRAGITVGLGTDNGMITRPDILKEIKVAYSLANAKARVAPSQIVRLAIFGGRKVLNVDAKITTEISEKTDLIVIRAGGEDPLRDLVTRTGSGDILAAIRGGKVGRATGWTR